MMEVTQLSNIAQFVFFVGCGYLAFQLPFGWVAALMSILLAKGIHLSGTSVWNLPLHVTPWISYLVISVLLIWLGIRFMNKFPDWMVYVFLGGLLLLTLVGIIFSTYTLFKMTPTFPLGIGTKILAFLVGAVLGAVQWIILHMVTVLNMLSSAYKPGLILTALTVSIICAVVFILGTYFMVTSPKAGYYILVGIAGIVLFLLIGLSISIGNSRWT